MAATAFLIADVSGKGLGAAILTTMLQGALSGMTLGINPASVFNHVNRFLCDHSEVGRYATMFFGILDQEGIWNSSTRAIRRLSSFAAASPKRHLPKVLILLAWFRKPNTQPFA